MDSPPPPQGETIRPIDVITSEIESIDVSLIDVRFKSPELVENQIVDKLSQLLERRNKLVDELNKARAKEFHEFIASLKLHELQITPFYPVPRRCKLQLNNPMSDQLIKANETESTSSNPWKKMLSSFMKKKEEEKQSQARVAIGSLLQTQQDIIAQKKTELQNEIQKLTRKPILSPTDIALKVRLQSELVELEKFEIRKRRQ